MIVMLSIGVLSDPWQLSWIILRKFSQKSVLYMDSDEESNLHEQRKSDKIFFSNLLVGVGKESGRKKTMTRKNSLEQFRFYLLFYRLRTKTSLYLEKKTRYT